jgi:hypothetical protein
MATTRPTQEQIKKAEAAFYARRFKFQRKRGLDLLKQAMAKAKVEKKKIAKEIASIKRASRAASRK